MARDKGSSNLPDMDLDRGCQVIKPPSALMRKAITPSKGFADGHNAINRAERALEELSANFEEWMVQEVEILTERRDKVRSEGVTVETLEALHLAAHDLRGQAGTFGYPLAAKLCGGLCELIEAMPKKERIPQVIIDHYVDSVRALVRQQVTTENDSTAIALIKKLRAVTTEFLEDELKKADKDQNSAA